MHWEELSSFDRWSEDDKDQFGVNVIKGLVMDGVRHANSGHTGGPMSSADFAYIVYKDFLTFSPDDPDWFNRDRFVLSAGHESMLLYSLLTFVGYLHLDDLRSFRGLGSRTPGHPECDLTPGVEATTGPLGQGVGMGIGMAIAEAILQDILGDDVVNHHTYILASDGDLQEPVGIGAGAIAGHLGLGKLIMFYDSNKVQISGQTARADTTDFATVFKGLHWQVIEIDGHDHAAIRRAVRKGLRETEKPTLIIGHTTMAKGSFSMEGDATTHGSPLPEQEILATKEKLGLPPDKFFLPPKVIKHFRRRFEKLRHQENEWQEKARKKRRSSEFAKLWKQVVEGELPEFSLPSFSAGDILATRKAFGQILTHLADRIPNLVGGSADLEPSNQTVGFKKVVGDFSRQNRGGRNFAFGVREFPMGVLLNGMALHGGLRPFGATFLVFSDYERPALRLRAIQKLPVLSIYTHDSFYLGKDGPTHQPVEHLSCLRSIPNFLVLRPADANEVTVAMEVALGQRTRPAALILSRQGLPVLDRSTFQSAEGARKGAYVLLDCPGEPDVILMASGSEVPLALEIVKLLSDVKVRVVSMPSWELFEEQEQSYKEEVLPRNLGVRVSIEAGSTLGWKQYTGEDGIEIGLDRFGVSGDPDDLARKFGFTAGAVARRIRQHLKERGQNDKTE